MPDLAPLFERMQEKPKSKRYAVTMSIYIWAESDQEAINNSEAFAKHQEETTDNQCKVVSVHDASTHKPRKIK